MKTKLIPAQIRPNTISAMNLSVGEMGKDTTTYHILLRTRSGVVDLSDPVRYWDDYLSSPTVEKLNVGDKVELTASLPAEEDEKLRDIVNAKVGDTTFGIGKIAAIKRVRDLTRLGLKEAKDYVDNL